MSFGFGVGDFLAVAKLAHGIWEKIQDSVDQFAAIRNEVAGLSSLLDEVSETFSKQKLAPKQAQGLAASAQASRSVLEDLQKLVDKYGGFTNEARGLTANIRKTTRKLKWDQDDARDLRARITSTITVLRALNFPAQQREIYSRHQQGSGQWLLKSERFRRWLESKGGVLLCPGNPGAGKTVLASIVIDHLWNEVRTDGIGVAYIYCDYLKYREQTPIHLAGSLLKQLAEQQNPFSESLKSFYDEHKSSNTDPNPKRAFEVLKAECDSWSRVYIIIDALDECSEKDATRQRVVEGLLSLQGSKRINILVTSRPIPSILCDFEVSERLEIRANSADIQTYLLGQMDRLSKRILAEKDLQAKIINGVVDAADGMFLLARLTFDSLVGQKTPKAIKGALDNLSRGSDSLDSAYEEAMKRIEDQHPASRDLAKRTLLWITYGQRSLSVAEMQQAVAIELGESDLDPDSTVDYDDIISACTGLVTKVLDSYGCDSLRLVHYSTQEYLERTTTKYFPKAQEYLASSCLTYLLFDVFSGASCTTPQYGDRSNDSDTGVGNEATEFLCFGCKTCWAAEQYEAKRWKGDALRYYPFYDLQLEQYPFYDYAAWYWGRHTENCYNEAIQILTKTFLNDMLRVSGAFRYIVDGVSSTCNRVPLYFDNPNRGSAMQLAAFLGLTKVVSKRLEEGFRPDVRDYLFGKTPFFWAVNRGHEHVVNLLMTRKDVNPNVRDVCGKTPLIEAVEEGHIAVVQLLLASEYIDINAKDVDEGWSALFYAVRKDLRILKLLLAQDNIQVNARDNKGQTVLHLAARQDWAGGILLLVACNIIQANIRDNEGQTALHIAARQGLVRGIQLLLACNIIQVNIRDNEGQTALHIAARQDLAKGIQLLLAHNDIQANIRDNKGQSALHWAAEYQRFTAVQVLLAHNDIRANIRDNKGQTALHIATLLEWAEGMQLLLAHGNIQANIKDNKGQTALHIATLLEWAEGMQLLLAHGNIQANIRDNEGQTALHIAATFQSVKVVQLLLAHNGLDVNATDDNGETALFGAVGSMNAIPRLQVIQLLLARGDVDVNIRDMYGSAPLYHAVRSGQPHVVRLLLTREDLEISTKDGEGGVLVSLAEDERVKAKREVKSDAYKWIIILLRSYIQEKSSDTTSANITQQNPQRHGHTDNDDDDAAHGMDIVQDIEE